MRALLLILAFSASDCIEPHLTVDINTRIEPDGTCTRRIEYRYEARSPAPEAEARDTLPAVPDPLKALHRFPSGPLWSVRDESQADVHLVLVEGRLASPEAIEGDYSRKNGPRVQPASNHVSYDGDPEAGRFEYFEVFTDPSSPQNAMRMLAEQLAQQDGHFAAQLERGLGSPKRSRRSELRRAFREQLAQPFLQKASELASHAAWGPRERRAFRELADDGLKEFELNLRASLATLFPSVAPERLQKVEEETLGDLLKTLLDEATAGGYPFPPLDEGVKFHATLTLPAPITRANGCPQGDTISWDFSQEDLYGRGFEMWARAEGSH